ncbi:hypothetical protein GCM10010406_53200 [Streptomyces thermolineatus]|uniref:PPE family domain-containing protein n=1 Tax=Streptomyces thermolineatus TaxID=44033 RepID=A0ABN3N0Y8_9ACTN
MGDGRADYEYTEPTACYAGKHSTPFSGKTLPEMKKMVANAKPGEVERVSKAWKDIETKLVGGSGVKETFDAAVEAVLQHWEGAAADAFRARAKVISQKITDSAKYAHNTSVAMKGAAHALNEYKPVIDNMEMPSTLDSAGDFIGDGGDRSDAGLKADLGNNVSTEDALGKHRDSLSAGKERQLEAAIVMEQLGAAYNSQTMAMGSWRQRGGREDLEDYPGDPGGVPPVAAVVPVSPAVSRPKPSAVGGGGGTPGTGTITPSKPVAPPRDSAVIGGAQKPVPVSKPQVGTVIDGVSGGVGGGSVGGGAAPGGSGGSVSGGAVGGGIAGGGAAGVVGGARGIGGAGGRGAAGVGGAAGRGAVSGGAAGRGGAVGGGRPGMPGAAGAPAGGRSGAAAGRGGGLARQRGGVVGGTPGTGGAARGTAGGSGLHRSRGAAQAAGGAGRPGGPMGAGVPRGRSDREREENRREGERPDYLVEDEETWATPRNVTPRVVDN